MTKEEFIKRVPEELQSLKQWVLFKIVPKSKDKTDKLPVNPVTGELAKSDDPNTWTDFQTALNQSIKRKLGIGFMFANGYAGVDVDGCRNKETEELTEQARDVLDTLQSYSEVSPSGTGIHVICKGKLPPDGRRKGSLEMYDSGRFFTVSGNVLADYPSTVEDRTEQLNTIHKKYIVKPEQPQARRNTNIDFDIVEKAIASKNGYKFKALYSGDWKGNYQSQSEADLAFCQMLAFWCAGDSYKMDSIFRQSGLMRKKWDEQHGSGTYGQMTISEALRNCKEYYIPGGDYRSKAKDEPAELELVRFSDIEVENIEWLFKPYIPLSKLTNITGYPGEGKTTYALKLCADISKMGFNSLYQSAEDGLSDTLKPRLMQFDADFSRIYAIIDKDGTLTFRDDRLEKMMEKIKPKLVVFDPIQAFLGKDTDFHRANETRPVLSRLVNLAQKYQCAIVLIMHLAKGERKHSVYSSLGSADIPAAARSILLVGKDPNDPTKGAIVHIKSSLATPGPSIGFQFTDDGFKLTGESSITADAILNQTKNSPEDTKLENAKSFLKEMLADGKEVLAADLYTEAAKLDISDRTLQRAKSVVGVSQKRSGYGKFGRWYWYIPCHTTPGTSQKELATFESMNESIENTTSYHSLPKKSLATFDDKMLSHSLPMANNDETAENKHSSHTLPNNKTVLTYTHDDVNNDDSDWEKEAKEQCPF